MSTEWSETATQAMSVDASAAGTVDPLDSHSPPPALSPPSPSDSPSPLPSSGASDSATASSASLAPSVSSTPNPLLPCKSVRKLKSDLSTVYLSFGGRQLRAAAIRTAARSRIKLTEEDWQMAPAAHSTAASATAARKQRQGAGQTQGRTVHRKRKRASVAESERPTAAAARNRPQQQQRSPAARDEHGSAAPTVRHSSRQRRQPLGRDVLPAAAASAIHTPTPAAAGSSSSTRSSLTTRVDNSAVQRPQANQSGAVRSQEERASLRWTVAADSDERMAEEAEVSATTAEMTAQHKPVGQTRPSSLPSASPPPSAATSARPTSVGPSVHSSPTERSAEAPQRAPFSTLRECPVLRPTVAEWSDPITFIKSVLPSCAVYGMCRIIPPPGWSPPFCLDSSRFKFTTRVQDIHSLQSGRPFVQNDGNPYTLRQFQVKAEAFKAAFVKQVNSANNATTAATATSTSVSTERMETAYWDIVNQSNPRQPSVASPSSSSPSSSSSSISPPSSSAPPPVAVQVEYGADLDSSHHGSGFESLQLRGDEVVNDNRPLYAGSIGWNLRALPLLSGSLLGLLDEHVPGVSTPWLYVGMLFSSFCWHTEDSYLLSMNYLHCGANKTWYATPGSQALSVQAAMKRHYPQLFAQQPDAHHSLTLQMSPFVLHDEYGVDVCHTVQQAGEFICTFPAAFHCGFSHGFNVGEAVNFAISEWLPFGRQAQQLDRQYARPECFSLQRLIITTTTARLQAARRGGGSSTALQAADNAILLRELDQLIADEQRDRALCVATGVTRFIPLASAQPAVKTSQVPMCSICSAYCFLSAVHCSACRLPVVCLAHVDFACSCESKSRVVVEFRYTIKQLTALRDSLHTLLK